MPADDEKKSSVELLGRPPLVFQPNQEEQASFRQWLAEYASLGLLIASGTTGMIAGIAYVQANPYVFASFAAASGLTLFSFLGKELWSIKKAAIKIHSDTAAIINESTEYDSQREIIDRTIQCTNRWANTGITASGVGLVTTLFTFSTHVASHQISQASSFAQKYPAISTIGAVGTGLSTLFAFASFNRLGPKLAELTKTHHKIDKHHEVKLKTENLIEENANLKKQLGNKPFEV